MAGRTPAPPAPPAQQTETALPDSNGAAPADQFDWSELAPSVAMPTKAAPSDIRVDVITTTPVPIMMRAEASLGLNTLAVKKAGTSSAKRKRIDYDWRVQPVASTEQGAKFAALLVRYAKYRPSDSVILYADTDSPKGQVTARCGETTWYRTTDDGIVIATTEGAEGAYLGIRYSVRPFEQRGSTARLPGTAS